MITHAFPWRQRKHRRGGQQTPNADIVPFPEGLKFATHRHRLFQSSGGGSAQATGSDGLRAATMSGAIHRCSAAALIAVVLRDWVPNADPPPLLTLDEISI
jgi:hypothetical protein